MLRLQNEWVDADRYVVVPVGADWTGNENIVGYPDGLKGKEIPLIAAIIAVADTYDAMTTDRPYRKALSREAANSELLRCSGTQLDPEVVQAAVEVL